jgi:type II secretory pathway pseudopilin PulG
MTAAAGTNHQPRRFRSLVRCAGWTLAEVLVVLGIIALLIAILIPIINRAQAAQKSVNCLANLRSIGNALRLYANDNKMNFPDPGSAVLSWEQMLEPYYQGNFQCPADDELYPTVGSSYDWRDTADPLTTLAGRNMADLHRTDFVMAFEALSGWHKKRMINVVYGDGSGATVDDDACFADLQRPLDPNIRTGP